MGRRGGGHERPPRLGHEGLERVQGIAAPAAALGDGAGSASARGCRSRHEQWLRRLGSSLQLHAGGQS